MKSLPIFPNFKKLAIEDKEILEDYVKKFLPYSDFNFTSLWTYDTNNLVEYSFLNSNLILLFQDYIDGSLFFTYLGKNQLIDTVEKLLNMSVKRGLKPLLKLVPEDSIDLTSLNKYFEVKEDRDNHDYILQASEIAELKGGKYYDKRNLVNRFRKKYPHALIKKIDIENKLIQQEMIELFLNWGKQTNKNKEEIETEGEAIKKLLSSLEHFEIFAQGIYHQNALIGFATYEISHNKFGIVSFQKANRDYEGVYSVLTHEIAKHLLELGMDHINFEQDLGIAGLRKAKQLWRPVKYLKKYTISAKK